MQVFIKKSLTKSQTFNRKFTPYDLSMNCKDKKCLGSCPRHLETNNPNNPCLLSFRAVNSFSGRSHTFVSLIRELAAILRLLHTFIVNTNKHTITV